MMKALVIVSGVVGQAPECKPFQDIYANGKEVCEKMWGDAFVYEEMEAEAYTMWFFTDNNPNDAVSALRTESVPDVCHLQYYHKEAPGPEPENFTECHPWKDSACCAHATVMSAETLNNAYGEGYRWDRCGKLSPECERFFVQEACFYECEPNAGLFRRYPTDTYDPRCDTYSSEYNESFAKVSNCEHNTWEVFKMPIKASYCDAWFIACRHDKFCAHDDGNFFSCAAEYDEADLLEKLKLETSVLKQQLQNESAGGANHDAAIIVPCVLFGLAMFVVIWMAYRERTGTPLFERLVEPAESKPSIATIVGSQGPTI